MRRLPFVASLIFSLGMLGSVAKGATFTVPLDFAVASGSAGDYLEADFDFGTRFSNIEQVQLEFMLPEGFQGGTSSTDGSLFPTKVRFVTAIDEDPLYLNDVLSWGTLDIFLPPGSVYSHNTIPAGEWVEQPFFFQQNNPNSPLYPRGLTTIPPYLLEGEGSIGAALLSTRSDPPFDWENAPPDYDDVIVLRRGDLSADLDLEARLVIVGTAVPEPGSLVLGAIAGLLGIAAYYPAQRARRRAVRQGTTAQASR